MPKAQAPSAPLDTIVYGSHLTKQMLLLYAFALFLACNIQAQPGDLCFLYKIKQMPLIGSKLAVSRVCFAQSLPSAGAVSLAALINLGIVWRSSCATSCCWGFSWRFVRH